MSSRGLRRGLLLVITSWLNIHESRYILVTTAVMNVDFNSARIYCALNEKKKKKKKNFVRMQTNFCRSDVRSDAHSCKRYAFVRTLIFNESNIR